MQPDFSKTASDYGRHRAGFPDSLFERLRTEYGVGLPGQELVDLGTGTGTLARGFAARGCRVLGIDPGEGMLGEAKRLAVEGGLEIDFRVGRAEETGLPDACADGVTAGQCWHWFDSPKAAREVARILRRPGLLVLAHFDWIPLDGNVAQVTETLIEAHNPEWKLGGGVGVHPWWMRSLSEAGFCELETFSYDLDVPYSHEDWRGRIRASAGVGASLSAERVEAFDAELGSLLSERFPEDPLAVLHRVFAIVARLPGPA